MLRICSVDHKIVVLEGICNPAFAHIEVSNNRSMEIDVNLGFPSLRTGAKAALPFIGLRPWRNGRRAALRSLWGNTRESSSLSGRTKILGYFPYLYCYNYRAIFQPLNWPHNCLQ